MLDAAEAANPGLEWQRVVNALDRVFLSHGGAMGQVSFLHSPSSILNGRTPLEAIAEPDGPSKICDAARAFSARSQTPVEANISPLGFSTPAQPLGSADAR